VAPDVTNSLLRTRGSSCTTSAKRYLFTPSARLTEKKQAKTRSLACGPRSRDRSQRLPSPHAARAVNRTSGQSVSPRNARLLAPVVRGQITRQLS
jgi:hypothetical protein